MSSSFDNDQFLELVRKWPAAVLQYLHRHFYHKLIHISRQRTNDLQASEDIVQDVLIDVWRRMERLTRRDGFLIAPYLLMMVKRKSISFYRKSASTTHIPAELLDLTPSSLPSAEDLLFLKDLRHQLRALIATLPRLERQCIHLKFIEGMSNSIIADRLGVSKKTVEKRLTVGIRLLQTRRTRIA